jgi:hypothetical protein
VRDDRGPPRPGVGAREEVEQFAWRQGDVDAVREDDGCAVEVVEADATAR